MELKRALGETAITSRNRSGKSQFFGNIKTIEDVTRL